MSMLKSIHTLLGHSYLARDYNAGFDAKEAGAAYYATLPEKGPNYFEQVESLTSSGGADMQMPDAYLIESDVADRNTLPSLEMAVHTRQPQSTQILVADTKVRQMVTTLPVVTQQEGVKGVFQFRASLRGLADSGEVSKDRVAIAQYVADQFAPFLEPRKIMEISEARRKLSSVDGSIEFLTGLKDLWQTAIQNWSQETYHHTVRVADLSDLIAKKIDGVEEGPMAGLKLPPKEQKLFKLSAELHDLGKLYTPRAILESGVPVPGVRYELDKKETEIMERHAQDVFDVFDIPGFDTLKKVRDIAASHHVFADGSAGYPEAVRKVLLEEGGIPFEGKLLAVSDIFEALTADREYREGMGLPLSTTLRIMGGMAKRGQIDGQILRFCVEHNVFEEFTKDKPYVSRMDPEFYEKLAYANSDMEKAAQVKTAISEEAKIPMDKLEGLLRLSTKKLFERAAQDANKEHKPGDFVFTVDMARIITQHQIKFYDGLKADAAGQKLQLDSAYADKILALSAREVDGIKRDKEKIATTLLHDYHGGDPKPAVEKLEQLVKQDIARTRGFYMGADPYAEHEITADIERIKYVLVERENEQLELARKAILTDIPAQPLGSTERFTLFQPQRYRASEASAANRE